MSIKWIAYHDSMDRMIPKSMGDVIEAMKYPVSEVVIATDDLIALDFVPYDTRPVVPISVYYFLRVGGNWYSCEWAGLSDAQRFAIRKSEVRIRIYKLGGYEDEGWEVLEALESL